MLVQAKQLPDAKAALCGCQDPWRFGETLSLSFGLQVQRFFQASSGPLGGTEALLESTFEAQGDFPWKSHRLAIRINQKNREYLSHPSFGEINIWNFSLLPVDLSPIFERQLGGCLFTCWWAAQNFRLPDNRLYRLGGNSELSYNRL